MALSTFYTLGNSGLRVTRLALGTMTFGDGSGWSNDEATSRALFDRYLEAGGNLIDTADAYTRGTSEVQVGKFVRAAGVRDRVVIATKYTQAFLPGNPNAAGNGRKNLIRAVEASLRRLDTDYIDLYQLHFWDQVTPAEEVLRGFDDLVSAGKVRYFGLSDVPAWYAARLQAIAEVRGLERPCSLQMEYSLLERNIEHEYVRLGTGHGMGILVWSPLASGLLSGKYSGNEVAGRLAKTAGTPLAFLDKRSQERTAAILDELRAVAQALDRPMAQVAVNWVASSPGVASVILGATRLAQLDDTLAALDFTLPPPLRARLDQVSAPVAHHPYDAFAGMPAKMSAGFCDLRDKPDGYRPAVHIGN